MKRLIIYDLDGTLVDTLDDLTRAANHMLRTLRADAVSADEVRRSVGRGLRELVRRCLKTEDRKRIDDGVAVYRAYYARHLVDRSRLYPGAVAVLEHFKTRAQALVTNKPDPFSSRILTSLEIAGYFREIIAGDAGYPDKPDPAAVRSLMQRGGEAPQETVMVGDSPIDVETGRHAGVLTVGILHGFADEHELVSAAPDLLVRNFDELLDVANRQQW